jgi:S-adenosylhomocysteine hydrolase
MKASALDVRSGVGKRLSAGDAETLEAEIARKAERHGARYHRLIAEASEVYASQFTGPAAEAWYRLTGVSVATGEPRYPDGFLPPQTILALRSSKGKAKVAHEEKVVRPSVRIGLRPEQAVTLALPTPVIEAALARKGSPAVAAVYAKIAAIEGTGIEDGILVPRDAGASGDETIDQVLGRVWRLHGKRPIALPDLERLLPKAIAALFRHLPNRSTDAIRPLFTSSTNEAVAWLADGFAREVWSGDIDVRGFFKSRGCEGRHETFLRAELPGAFGTPPPPVVASLFRKTLAGELSARGFYSAIGMRRDDFTAYVEKHRRLFPKEAMDLEHLPISAKNEAAEEASASAKIARAEVDMIALGKAAGPIAWAFLEARPLATRIEVVAAINANQAFLAAHARMTTAMYGRLAKSGAVPKTRKGNQAWRLERLAREANRLLGLRDRPRSKKALIEAMRAFHSGFDANWLRKLTPLIGEIRSGAEDTSTAARDAQALEALLRSKRPKTLAAAAEMLGAKHDRFTYPYVRYLADYHLALDPKTAALVASSKRAALGRGVSPIIRAVHSTVLRCVPPGTDAKAIAELVNDMLVERGIPAQKLSRHREWLASLEPGPTELHAKVLFDLAVEYRSMLPKGTAEADLWARVRSDFPSLTAEKIGTLRRSWTKDPMRLPRTKVAHPRYFGGWDMARIAATASMEEKLELARASQRSRLMLHLPLLDMMLADLGGKKPFAKYNVLCVGHLLGQAYPFAHALRAAGAAKQGELVMVSSPYGGVEVVADALREANVDARVPALTEEAYEEEIEKGLDAIVAQHRRNGRPILVVDDGGFIATLLHTKPEKYADVLHAVRIVEQTTGGVIMAERFDLRVPISTVARSRSKKAEAPMIGRTVAAKALQALRRIGRDLDGKKVTIVGYGYVGEALAKALRDAGAIVTIVEKTRRARRAAVRDGFAVRPLDRTIETADIVFGATGSTSVGIESVRKMKNGAIFASVSSKRREFAMKALEKVAGSKEPIPTDTPLSTLPSARYRVFGKTLIALGDGWPINFDGDIDSVPLAEIQLTLAALFAGLLHATKLRAPSKQRGFMRLDRILDDRVLSRFRELRKGKKAPPISSLDDWAAPLVAIAERAARARSKAGDSTRGP